MVCDKLMVTQVINGQTNQILILTVLICMYYVERQLVHMWRVEREDGIYYET